MTTTLSPPRITSWQSKRLFFFHVLIACLLLSLFSPLRAFLWNQIDRPFFEWVNAHLKTSQSVRLFWAYANQRLADWIADGCIFLFCVLAVRKAGRGARLKKSSQLIFCLLLTATTILLFNRLLCRDLLSLRRASPCHVVEGATLLSDYISAFPIKEFTKKSFPGDHATTALMFGLSYAFVVKERIRWLALLFATFLCLPRLVVGAHWLSDIVVGSGCIALFSLSWAFHTPCANLCSARIEKMLRHFLRPFIK